MGKVFAVKLQMYLVYQFLQRKLCMKIKMFVMDIFNGLTYSKFLDTKIKITKRFIL